MISTTINSLKVQFTKVRQQTVELCAPLNVEDYIPQPVDFASPPKWHLAHTTWFFEAFVLEKFGSDYSIYHKDFSFLFNSYYNGAGDRILRTDRGNITRPTVDEVYAYRNYVDKAMLKLMDQNDSTELAELVTLGLNHEQQHQELLLTDLKHTFAHNPIFPVYKKGQDIVNSIEKDLGFVQLTEGIYEVGYNGNGFCYDNELNRHKVYIQNCSIRKSLVSNKEYIEFMDAGAYSNFALWLDAGWSWVNEHKIQAPLYWHKIDGEWFHYTLAGLQKVKPEATLAHISFYEAAAFAEWKGMRLLTEFEWEVAAEQFTWGSRWEWTNSAYLPYPGFATADGALGEYNGKFMINQMVLRGASVATSPDHSRITYRNFFPTDMRWQFTGIRLAKR